MEETTTVTHVPPGRHTITPPIVVQGSSGLIQFLRRTFSATGDVQNDRPSEIGIGDSVIMISDAGLRESMPAFLYVYVDDVDATYQRALNAGATSVEEPLDLPYGDRRGMVRDAWGNLWQIATRQTPGEPGDPFGGRRPTSHERLTGLPWDASYHDGPAPWDIGQPQPAIVRVASEGGFAGAVLDAGCGTGENALHVASLGLSVLGVDVAETALAIARQKAADRGIDVEFAAADAFHLDRLGRKFETVLDCGLFTHSLATSGHDTVASLASVTKHDGTLYVLCFSDEGDNAGPHPVSQQELRAALNPAKGSTVGAIEPDRVQTRYHGDTS